MYLLKQQWITRGDPSKSHNEMEFLLNRPQEGQRGVLIILYCAMVDLARPSGEITRFIIEL